MKHFDVIVIGSGVVAANLVNTLSEEVSSVKKGLLIRSNNIHCASLHNQTWMQSGGIYHVDDIVAELCRTNRFKLMSKYRMKINPNSVFMFNDINEVDSKLKFFSQDDIWKQHVNPLDFNRSKEYLGDLCNFVENQNNPFLLTMPDQNFNEEDLINFCLYNAYKKPGAKFKCIISDTGAVLKSNPNVPNKYTILVNGEEYYAEKTFLATGIGTLKLLQPLGIDDELKLTATKSILLKTPNIFNTGVEIFADRIEHISIVKQVHKYSKETIYLLGNGNRFSDIDMLSDNDFKKLTKAEMRYFLEGFDKYPEIKRKIEPYAMDINNYSICAKIERSPVNGKIDYTPICHNFDNTMYKGLFAVLSGKATLSLYAAEKALGLAGYKGFEQSSKNKNNNIDMSLIENFNDVDIWYNKN